MENPTDPPIASAYGSGTPMSPEPLVENVDLDAIRVFQSHSAQFRTLLRLNLKSVLSLPNWYFLMLFMLPLLPFSIVMTALTELKKPRKETPILTLERMGVRVLSEQRQRPIPWNKVLSIREWAGDVFIVTSYNARPIAREDFNSLEEAREFVRIARELKESNGAAWRDEWNGRVFGA